MSYTAIPRKYRPQKFSEVTGQEFITETLKNAIKTGKFAHAYIFAGPRGVGKTTTARIVAKALNCENPKDGEPCNECAQCLEITKGTHPDVIEIDAASNRGIDQIRELRESVIYSPAKGKKKVYIIDEFHMLTKEAFNALLKTLEEPPEHVVFILATTELDKIPETILSRCQKFIFRRIPQELIVKTLSEICKRENVEFEEEALRLVAVSSEGCMRDAESLLDQLIALGEGKIETRSVSEFLGLLTGRELKELLKLGFEGNKEELKNRIKNLERNGYNPTYVIKQLLETVEREFFTSSPFSQEELIVAFEILSEGYRKVLNHPYPFTSLFFSLFKLSYFKEVKLLSDLLKGNLKIEVSGNEKKDDRQTLNFFVEKSVDRGDYVEIVPKGETAFATLSKRIQELQQKFKKQVKLVKPESSAIKKFEISKETNEELNRILKSLNAKIIEIKPKEKK
jgi:DNA polymerase-3 subunit gamma/tau